RLDETRETFHLPHKRRRRSAQGATHRRAAALSGNWYSPDRRNQGAFRQDRIRPHGQRRDLSARVLGTGSVRGRQESEGGGREGPRAGATRGRRKSVDIRNRGGGETER